MHRITLAIVIFAVGSGAGIAETILPCGIPQDDHVFVHQEAGTHAFVSDETIQLDSPRTTRCTVCPRVNDRLWVVNTRSLTTNLCSAPLDNPPFRVSEMGLNGHASSSSTTSILACLSSDRPVVIHVHGNRMTESSARERGVFVYNRVAPSLVEGPIDFIVFSWPSDQEGFLLRDGRAKAERTDVESLYLGWFLRELTNRSIRVGVIGFSFGGRIATGALHANAGGRLGGRSLPGEHRVGMDVKLGLIAPALEDDWLQSGNYHGLATKNISQLSILYNARDAVLKRYWLLDRVRGNVALGFTGPRRMAPGFDGRPVPLISRDCSTSLGIQHDEKEYYAEGCWAGAQMAKLFNSMK